MNSRITKKERGLVKGSIRRVFSRSDLHHRIVELSRIDYQDPIRPRVTRWSKCANCNAPTPTYKIAIDHIDPVIKVNESLEDLSWDTLIDRLWCEEENLQPLCLVCHKGKTSGEAKLRAKCRKEKKAKDVK